VVSTARASFFGRWGNGCVRPEDANKSSFVYSLERAVADPGAI
jgi:hypothetical protein